MMNMPHEQPILYPSPWADVYGEKGFVQVWRDEFPDLFKDHKGSTRLKTLDLFPQYALMYLLRKRLGIESITWFYLADRSKRSGHRDRTLRYWSVMKARMGAASFITLQTALWENGFTGFKGEPDLFCWDPKTGNWFFAEAKRRDPLGASQEKWFAVCWAALGPQVDIRVYRLIPEPPLFPADATISP